MNKVILIGNLGTKPEMRDTKSDKKICTFSIATNTYAKDGQEAETEWHNIVAFGKNAENCAEYLKKGSKVAVDGRLKPKKWEDKSGNKQYGSEIIVNSIEFVDSKAA